MKENYDTVARFFARNMIKNVLSVYTEHIKGSLNSNMADSLSKKLAFPNNN